MIREYPSWFKLYLIGAAACLGLFLEAQMSISNNAHHLLLLAWIVVVYLMIARWLNTNRQNQPSTDSAISSPQPVAEFLDEDRLQIQQAYAGIEFPSEFNELN